MSATLPEENAWSEHSCLLRDTIYHRIQQKGIQKVINPFHPRELHYIIDPCDAHIREYDMALDHLAGVLGSMKRAVLTGGLAIPATLLAQHPGTRPRFYRQHYALHVGVARSQFPELVQQTLLADHYYPFARLRMISIKDNAGTKVSKEDMYYSLSWNEVQKLARGERMGRVYRWFRKSKNIRLIRVESNLGEIAPHESLTDYIDVYLHHYRGGKLRSNDDCSRECPRYFNGAKLYTFSGKPLNVVNLAYLELIKRERFEKNKGSKKGETDRYDLEHIASLLRESNYS